MGANCVKALEPNKKVEGRTIPSWWIVGPVEKRLNCDNNHSCQKVSVNDVGSEKVTNHNFAIEESFKETGLERIPQNMYQHEFTVPQQNSEMIDLIDPSNGTRTDHMRLLRLIKKETIMGNGHYQIPLPLKDVNVNFPNNQKQALWRPQNLQKKFA